MSATVDIGCLQAQLKNIKAILTGVFLQFVVLPFLGFAVVKALNMSHAMGITLLVVTSSPGGSYSNWWCSMFNADLALSVCMTCVSTFLSIVMLPVNLLIYARLAYEDDVIGSLDWKSLFISLAVVIGAIGLGLLASEKFHSHAFNVVANKLGNFAGIALVIFSAVVGSGGGESSGDVSRGWEFYVGVALPCVLGLIVANIVTSCLHLAKPERVTTSIECCYQNVGIATSVALTMFEGDELVEAMGVPLFYGLVEAVVLGIYCLIAWKAGWTKSPPDTPFFTMISTSYEVVYAETAENEQLKSLTDGEVDIAELEKAEGEVTADYALQEDEVPPPPSKRAGRDSIIIAGTPQRRNPRKRLAKEPSYIQHTLPPTFIKSLKGDVQMSAVKETDEDDES
eukprot:CAMPEP_0197443536 /NCGR_PEP_ID=MMETSP1175-20131217/9253_1 /TAXON_ID=1003142 /ORGANISM="Triceratium dubium, Strain CCMP147" /LENGTH=396 /DNA_ID=CAMNT_0042974183 /DNA_START=92 /DNA_END=1285 /DNA_ORIENTATION=-